MHNKNVDKITNVSNSGLSIVTTPVNKHNLQINKTEAAIKDNLEVVLNTLCNLKNDNDNLINKSIADNKIIGT